MLVGLVVANVILASAATLCVKLFLRDDDGDDLLRPHLLLMGFLANACSFSLLPFLLRTFPLGVAQLTVSSGTVLASFAVGRLVLDEEAERRHLVAVLLFLSGLAVLHLTPPYL